MSERLSNKDFAAIMAERLKLLGIQVLRFVEKLPNNPVSYHLQGQIIRSGTSGGANYRAAIRAKSKADFVNKLKIVEEELDETLYFIEIFESVFPEIKEEAKSIKTEADDLLKIIVKSIQTSRQ